MNINEMIVYLGEDLNKIKTDNFRGFKEWCVVVKGIPGYWHKELWKSLEDEVITKQISIGEYNWDI